MLANVFAIAAIVVLILGGALCYFNYLKNEWGGLLIGILTLLVTATLIYFSSWPRPADAEALMYAVLMALVPFVLGYQGAYSLHRRYGRLEVVHIPTFDVHELPPAA